MTDAMTWQAQNDKFLGAALNWLRLRLQERVAAPPAPEPAPAGSLFGWMKGKPAPAAEIEAGPAVQAAAQAMDEAAAGDPAPALTILAERLGLSHFEQQVLLLCAAPEMDTRIPALCAQAQGDPNRAYPTFALALAYFDQPAWDVLSPERPLRLWRLLEINQSGAQPLTTSPLRADERIVNYLKGLNYLDDRLVPLLVPFDGALDGVELPPSQQKAADLAVRFLHQAVAGGQRPLVQLLGSDSLSKQLVAVQAADKLGLQLVRLPAELLPAPAAELETLARLWQRESLLLPIALYLDAHDFEGAALPEGQSPPLQRFLARGQGVIFLSTREMRPGLEASLAAVEVDKPSSAEQAAAWAEALGGAAGDSPAMLAGQFNLNLPGIRQIARVTSAGLAQGETASLDQLWEACLTSTRPRMDLLAQRLDAKATWDDIVLPEETLALLRQIADQVRQRNTVYNEWGFRQKMNRGLGISALFAGPSGTGKTMAAEVIANQLHLNLYRIDLSQVVSKYIGETEKNLRRVFDVAEGGGALLFFDEADAIFGKRSEVKDSHDRYANIEISYLLQRMEQYHGLAVLATNMKSALDVAFMRRLRFIANFPFPGPKQRQLIWPKVFPPATPKADLDWERLAGFDLTGGSIHNVVLNAAFLAAQAGTPVTMPLVLEAARAEFRKLERPVNEADFK
jgi:ATP-dependent 26S proteasome regulatory subunit